MARQFGSVRQLPAKSGKGRWQARYRGPDGKPYTARTDDNRPLTFTTEKQARKWLDRTHDAIESGTWLPPDAPKPPPPITVREYAEAHQTDSDLAQTTRDHNAQLLRDYIYPTFGDVAVVDMEPGSVKAWWADLKRRKVGPTQRAHAYGLLRTIMNAAIADDVIQINPCRVRGAGQAKRASRTKPATLGQLEMMVTAMPERLRLMVLFAAWCALRFGELAELRRSDIDTDSGVIHVRRGVVRTKGRKIVKSPKSDAGIRDVTIPAHLLPAVREHLRDHAQPGPDGLLFPGQHGAQMAPSALYGRASWTTKGGKVRAGYGWYGAREAAGRPDLRFHDLRHTGAVLAASTGATLAALMARLGHSTPGAAMRYQHAADDADQLIADGLAKLATVTPITAAKSA